MTQAYIEGFCKAAEAYGVDPEQLVKVAKTIKEASAKTIRVGAKKLDPSAISKYILGGKPTSRLYLSYPKHKVPAEYRAGILDNLLANRARRMHSVGRAVDKANLSELMREKFMDSMDKARHSGADTLLSKIRTNLLNSGKDVPTESIGDIQSSIRRWMSI